MVYQTGYNRPLRKPWFNHRVSIRFFLIIPFAILMATMIGVLTLLAFMKSTDAVEAIKIKIRERTLSQIQKSLTNYIETAQRLNRSIHNYITKGRLDLKNPIALQDYFWNQLIIYQDVNYIYFGYKNGGILLVARRSDGVFVARQTDGTPVDNFPAALSTTYALDNDGNRIRLLERRELYDARKRPWFMQAVQRRGPIWTEVYPFFLENSLGMTTATPYYDEKGDLLGVIGTDILLSTFSTVLKNLKSGEQGEVFIIEDNGTLIASTADPTPFLKLDKDLHRISAQESKSNVIKAAYEKFKNDSNLRRYDISVNGDQHLVEMVPFQNPAGINWYIGITVSEADILGIGREALKLIIYFGIGAFILSTILCYILGQRLASPLLGLKAVATSLANQNINARANPSGIREINTLASTFNFMADQIQRSVNVLKKKNSELKNEIEQKREAQRRIRFLKEEIDIKQRTKLAGELHDGIGQSLQALNLGLRMLHQSSPASGEQNTVQDLVSEVEVAITQLRTIIEQQRPMFLDQMDIITAIESYGKKLGKRSNFTFTLHTNLKKLEIESYLKEPIFLILQEALNNISKYAKSKNVVVQITVSDHHIFYMRIEDDGIGFDLSLPRTDRTGGLGLSLMAERAESIGGRLKVVSNPNMGTQIHMEAPLHD